VKGGETMAAKTLLKRPFPILTVRSEKERLSQIYKVLKEPKPEIEHTPRKLVWKKNKSSLWYYPAQEKKYDIPVFVVYSLLNKPYILDMSEEGSVIGNLTRLGYDVYMFDWGSPGLEDKDMTLDNYVVDYLEVAVKRALRHSSADEISLIGYCLGGTLSAMLASITELPIRNLVLAAVPIDYSDFILPKKWVKAIQDGTIDINRFSDAYGHIPSEYLQAMFDALQGFNIGPKINLVTRAHDKKYVEKWRRMDKWMHDPVAFAGAAFKQTINELFKENMLVKGEMEIGGRKVELKNIKCSLLIITSTNDELVLESQSRPVMDLVSSEDKTYQLVEAGHVSVALTGQFAAAVDPWLSTRSH
jgi:class III poly(R)-hydroxyalkanoic acid synthase PhaC subunit